MTKLDHAEKIEDAKVTVKNLGDLASYSNRMGWPATSFYLSLAAHELSEMLTKKEVSQKAIIK